MFKTMLLLLASKAKFSGFKPGQIFFLYLLLQFPLPLNLEGIQNFQWVLVTTNGIYFWGAHTVFLC